MKITELMHQLRQIKKKHGDLECIYAIDDEGNDHHPVHFHPTPMKKDIHGFRSEEDKPKFICIN